MSGKSKFCLKIDDVMCIACRGILIKPVTMPCQHSLCSECFDRTIECNTLTCPYCRKRMGSWVRSATKGKKLINERFWQEIQDKFSIQVQKKLNGEDDGIEDIIINQDGPVPKRLSKPGELLEEYQTFSKQIEEEKRREREKEELASLEFIKKLQEEEDQREAERRIELELLAKQDEEIAKKLLITEKQKDTGNGSESTETYSSSPVPSTSSSSSSSKKSKPVSGPLDLFVRSAERKTPISGSSKEDYNHFRPIKPSPVTPTKIPPSSNTVLPQKVTPLSRRSFFERKSLDVSALSPKPTLSNSSFISDKCAFALSPTKNKAMDVSKNTTKSLSPEKSDDSETDFEDNCNDEKETASRDPQSFSTSNTGKNSDPKINVGSDKLTYKAMKSLENELVQQYCKLSEDSNSHLVNSLETSSVKTKFNRNIVVKNQLPSTQSKELYAFLEEQVLEDYKLALKLQEELDKENLADRQRLKNSYELRKRSRVSEPSIIKQANKKPKLAHSSSSASKQRTIEEAFQLKST